MIRSKLRKQIFFCLIILLLVSLCYLAMDIVTFLEGEWQLVHGQEQNESPEKNTYDQINIPVKIEYPTDYWEVLHAGKLFFKTPIYIPNMENPIQELPNKPNLTPTCPWVLKGILWAEDPSAIIAHQQSKLSLTVRIGSIVDDYEVITIKKDYIVVKSLEAEFRLELGGI